MKNRKYLTVKEVVVCGVWAAFIAVGSFVKVPLPIVPFTLQFFFSNLVGLLCGGKIAAVAVAIYIALGLVGLPIFYGGYGGIGYLLNPNFGFILGILLGAYLCGSVADTSTPPSFAKYLFASLCNVGLIYPIGLIYYCVVTNYYLMIPMSMGYLALYLLLLVIPGDLLLCVVTSAIARRLIPTLQPRWGLPKHRKIVPIRFDPVIDN